MIIKIAYFISCFYFANQDTYSGSKNWSYSAHFFLSLSDPQQRTIVKSCGFHRCVQHSLLSIWTNFQAKILFLWSLIKKIGKCIIVLMSKNCSYSYSFLPISSLLRIRLHKIIYHSKEKIVLNKMDWKRRQITQNFDIPEAPEVSSKPRFFSVRIYQNSTSNIPLGRAWKNASDFSLDGIGKNLD